VNPYSSGVSRATRCVLSCLIARKTAKANTTPIKGYMTIAYQAVLRQTGAAVSLEVRSRFIFKHVRLLPRIYLTDQSAFQTEQGLS